MEHLETLNIKKCPECHVLVEKKGGCNRVICNCGFIFCWLCMKDAQGWHYNFWNLDGCPGDQFSNEKSNSFYKLF